MSKLKNAFTLEIGQAVPQPDGSVLAVMCVDHSTNYVLLRPFESAEEWIEQYHQYSLKSFPKWHRDHCTTCQQQGSKDV